MFSNNMHWLFNIGPSEEKLHMDIKKEGGR